MELTKSNPEVRIPKFVKANDPTFALEQIEGYLTKHTNGEPLEFDFANFITEHQLKRLNQQDIDNFRADFLNKYNTPDKMINYIERYNSYIENFLHHAEQEAISNIYIRALENIAIIYNFLNFPPAITPILTYKDRIYHGVSYANLPCLVIAPEQVAAVKLRYRHLKNKSSLYEDNSINQVLFEALKASEDNQPLHFAMTKPFMDNLLPLYNQDRANQDKEQFQKITSFYNGQPPIELMSFMRNYTSSGSVFNTTDNIYCSALANVYKINSALEGSGSDIKIISTDYTYKQIVFTGLTQLIIPTNNINRLKLFYLGQKLRVHTCDQLLEAFNKDNKLPNDLVLPAPDCLLTWFPENAPDSRRRAAELFAHYVTLMVTDKTKNPINPEIVKQQTSSLDPNANSYAIKIPEKNISDVYETFNLNALNTENTHSTSIKI